MERHPLLDLNALLPGELDLCVLDEEVRTKLTAHVPVLKDSEGGLHLASCMEVGEAAKPDGERCLANLYYHLAECCDEEVPSETWAASSLAGLVLHIRGQHVLTSWALAGQRHELETMTEDDKYAPLAPQLRDALERLEGLRTAWVEEGSEEEMLLECGRRSLSACPTTPAPDSVEEYIEALLQAPPRTDAADPDPAAVTAHAQELRKETGELLVRLVRGTHVFNGEVITALLPADQDLLRDVLASHRLRAEVVRLPKRYRSLVEFPCGNFVPELEVVDVSEDTPAVLETAETLIKENDVTLAEALAWARELA